MDTITETINPVLEVNRLAQRNRHLKVFSRGRMVKLQALQLIRWTLTPVGRLSDLSFFVKVRDAISNVRAFIGSFVPHSPQKRLFFQAGALAVAAILTTSFTYGSTLTTASMSYSSEYIQAYAVPGDVLVSDDDGYLVKINPQTDVSSRVGLTDYAIHTIEGGESLSTIAELYSVNVQTIMWENNISNANSIRAGQKLLIPPVNGISYKVASGDTLEKLATRYKIESSSIVAQNNLETDILTKGQTIFLPGAEPLRPVNTVASNYRATSVTRDTRASYANASPSSDTPSVGKIFIFPTVGKVTQGFRAGHYALDIADRSQPPIWAAGGGVVVKASSGTWGGGYGTHVIIDHGNGVQTLYAHMSSLNVEEGQEVSQGDVIGIMGNTGRVYGATGIHLHWEVIDNGVKKYPGNYY